MRGATSGNLLLIAGIVPIGVIGPFPQCDLLVIACRNTFHLYSLWFPLSSNMMLAGIIRLYFGRIFGGETFLFKYLIQDIKDIIISSSITNNWNLKFRCDLFKWEVGLVATFMETLNDVFISKSNQDWWIWLLVSSGSFSSKSSFRTLVSSNDSTSPNLFPWKKI